MNQTIVCLRELNTQQNQYLMSRRKQRQAVKESQEARKIFRVIAFSTAILLVLLFVMYQVTS